MEVVTTIREHQYSEVYWYQYAPNLPLNSVLGSRSGDGQVRLGRANLSSAPLDVLDLGHVDLGHGGRGKIHPCTV